MAANPASDAVQPPLPMFKGAGYERWSTKMKTLFRSQGIWKVIEKGVLTSGEASQIEESQKDDARALYLIQQAVDDSIFDRIAGVSSAKEAWELVQKLYQGTTKIYVSKKTNLTTKV